MKCLNTTFYLYIFHLSLPVHSENNSNNNKKKAHAFNFKRQRLICSVGDARQFSHSKKKHILFRFRRNNEHNLILATNTLRRCLFMNFVALFIMQFWFYFILVFDYYWMIRCKNIHLTKMNHLGRISREFSW